ncbi:MAG: LD-carboxypeptidase [Chitinophagia bacterium]|nr:LD-carboxypeptidase [Chitinophagia bacterium]
MGYMQKEKAQTCIATLQQWGFEVMVGNTLGSKSKNYFSGTDEIRLNELQAMLDDKSIKAILCGRGGYGVSRIIDQLDFTRFKKNPKWIIGFSDITLLHAHINRNLKIATLHAPMAAAFNNGENKNEFINSLHKALVGKKAKYFCKADPFNKLGEAKGELVGGNLTLITHLIGTKSDINTKNKILFIEDIGELIYSTDRMLHQLKRSGKLTNLAALIVGGFSDVKDTERPFGKKVKELIKDILQDYDYPVCFDFQVGHKKENYALKIGSNFQLKITKTKVLLSEL